MTNLWFYSPLKNEKESQKLANELNISPVLARLLVQRGVTTFEEAKKFFRPRLEDLHDPFLMVDMDKAVERLSSALSSKEKILIYGDYDVDGTTAVALVYLFLINYCASSEIDYYIPNRYTEGYGISYDGIDYAADNGFSLIIALDCGIKAVEKVEYARQKGVDVIICDHHTPDEVLPDAVAVLDPKREDSTYPYNELSGCGVGFKLMHAFAMKHPIEGIEKQLFRLLDLLAVSIASDIVPITGENRVLAYYGLKQINEKPTLGLKSIIEVCELADKPLSISDIVFKIGPRINASGRMENGKKVVELLISKDIDFARERSAEINGYNEDRKSLDKSITEEAIQLVKNNEEYQGKKSIVVFNSNWGDQDEDERRDKGVIGIVASRLSEKYYRPTVVLTQSNGLATGSARSVPGFDLYKAIDSCRHLLENFGGHMYAAGLSMKVENVEEFKRCFEQYVSENITEEQQCPKIEIDADLELREIDKKFFRVLSQFSPFGPGNMKPVFCTHQVHDCGYSRRVGKELKHLKLEVSDDSEYRMNGIAFGKGDVYEQIKYNKLLSPRFSICYTLEENVFNGTSTVQLMVRDIKLD
ncbi:MAG: single-stranded-DNA-specific exonuclease RecJ [Paludibacteraceae bacterium]|nr:single-stranded-DNA-specific exonuclease RecJ [Paludibacteraceae bacterium]